VRSTQRTLVISVVITAVDGARPGLLQKKKKEENVDSMLRYVCMIALALAGASASADLAFVGGARSLGVMRRPAASAIVEMRGPKPSTKMKGAKIRSAVAKRMKVTAGGKILRRRANKQHLLSAKTHSNKKHAGKIGQVDKAMHKNYMLILQA